MKAGGQVQFRDHRITFKDDDAFRVNEVNEVNFEFENTFGEAGDGLQKEIDVEDSRMYFYTHCEPFFCHRWFPCFDQPSLKAIFDL